MKQPISDRTLLIFVCVVTLCGCATRSDNRDNAVVRLETAQQLVAENRLNEALVQVEIANSLDPNNQQIAAELQRIKSEIADIKASYLSRLETDSKLTPFKRKQLLLNLLVLDPNDRQALKSLRTLTHVKPVTVSGIVKKQKTAEDKYSKSQAGKAENRLHVEKIQAFYDAGEYKKALTHIDNFLKTNSGNASAVVEVQFDSFMALSAASLIEHDVDKAILYLVKAAETKSPRWRKAEVEAIRLKEEQSDKHYQKGLSKLKYDLQSAIFHFEKSLEYNPQNANALSRLKLASVMLKKLNKIKANN